MYNQRRKFITGQINFWRKIVDGASLNSKNYCDILATHNKILYLKSIYTKFTAKVFKSFRGV